MKFCRKSKGKKKDLRVQLQQSAPGNMRGVSDDYGAINISRRRRVAVNLACDARAKCIWCLATVCHQRRKVCGFGTFLEVLAEVVKEVEPFLSLMKLQSE
jgi:hypothetical protein